MDKLSNREAELAHQVNQFLSAITGTEDDYYDKLLHDENRLWELKQMISAINGTLTLKLTLRFLEWLKTRDLDISDQDFARMENNILNQSAYANGFDVFDEQCHMMAEVKCNLIVNNFQQYRSRQRDLIYHDICSLWLGKNKQQDEQKQPLDPRQYTKFLVLLKNENSKAAFAKLVGNTKKEGKNRDLLRRLLGSEIELSQIINVVDEENSIINKEQINVLFLPLK